jgi:predicted ester cyclase
VAPIIRQLKVGVIEVKYQNMILIKLSFIVYLCRKNISFRMKNLCVFLVLSVAACLFVRCSASKKLRTAQKNEETVRLWFEEGWNKKRNNELVERVFSPNWEDGNPIRSNQTTGYEGIRQMVHFYELAFADAHFTITHLFANETYVSLRYDVSARHVGPAFGILPTGKVFTSSGIVIYEMEHARIKRTWQELDLMGIIKQLKPEGPGN